MFYKKITSSVAGKCKLDIGRRRFTACAAAVAVSLICCETLAQPDVSAASELSLLDVAKVIDHPNWILVDTRSTDAYNGWKLDGVKRGGHLPGAVDFPARWLESEHEHKAELLSTALRVKGVEPHRRVVLYGTSKRDRRRVAAYLRNAGFRNLYDFDLKLWAEDESKPLLRYANYQFLVPPSIVKQLLDGQLPETFEHSKRLKFVEVSWGGEDASYSKGHVPRSFHVNTDHFEPPPKWKLGDPDTLRSFAKKYGFRSSDTVILSSADPTASYRLAVVLRYMGVADVRILNGGFAAWKAAGYPVETKSIPPSEA